MRTVLVIVIFIGLAAVVGPLVIGTNSFDGTVVDRPYERGLEWDREQRKRADSGLSVEMLNKSLRVGGNIISFRIRQREGKPLTGQPVIIIRRPSSRTYDRTYTAVSLRDGQFNASVDLPLYGWWDVLIKVPLEGELIQIEKRIFAER